MSVGGARSEGRLVLALVALAACGPKHATVNHPPTVRAHCEPCSIPPGGTANLTAQGQDADGDRLNYRWTVAAGRVSLPSASATSWTAPMQEGPVPVAITVRDGRGGSASDVVTIQVVKPKP